jgi:hypothetical protein
MYNQGTGCKEKFKEKSGISEHVRKILRITKE